MGEMFVFNENDEVTVLGANLEKPLVIVIHCDLCNEPIAITPAANDTVFLQCLKCHAVNGK